VDLAGGPLPRARGLVARAPAALIHLAWPGWGHVASFEDLDEASAASSPPGMIDDLLDAIGDGQLSKAKALLSASPSLVAEVSAQHECTALHYACRHARREAALLLIELGADVNTPDLAGESPLECAVIGSATEAPYTVKALKDRQVLVEALLRAGANIAPGLVTDACEQGRGKVRPLVAALLAHGARLEGAELLHAAVEYDLPEVVDALLAQGANLDEGTTGGFGSKHPRGTTALHIAVKKGAIRYIELLVAAGARTDIANEKDQTARSLAPRKLIPMLEAPR
jgi:ankyrin repeat protein